MRVRGRGVVASLVALIATSGCGTIADASRGNGDFLRPGPSVYGGLITDLYALGLAPVLVPILLIDVPLSLAADTLMLPITLAMFLAEEADSNRDCAVDGLVDLAPGDRLGAASRAERDRPFDAAPHVRWDAGLNDPRAQGGSPSVPRRKCRR
ncbi:hypothetical protein OAX78_03685 [Planctomycetota bacterium]|nr:hypothetical protein [Planctomycetota bacterium]